MCKQTKLFVVANNFYGVAREYNCVSVRDMKVSRLDSATVRNSFRPYQAYIYNGNYPLVRTIYALLTEPRTGMPTRFANFCSLPQGQKIIFSAGLLPNTPNMNVRNVNVVK